MKERGTRENDEMQNDGKTSKNVYRFFRVLSWSLIASLSTVYRSWPAALLLVIAASKGLFVYNKNSVVYAAIQSTCWFDESALVWYIDSLLLGSSHISSLPLSLFLCLSVLHARPRHKLNNNAGRLCFFFCCCCWIHYFSNQNIDICTF